MNRRMFLGAQTAGAVALMLDSGKVEAQGNQNYLDEPSRKIEYIEQADIVILGGGPAGCAAAVAAGRLGADVLLVERYGYLGGLMTGGLVILIGEYDRRLTGLPKEFTEKSLATGECKFVEYAGRRVPDEPIGNPEVYKQMFFETAEAAGVRFLFHSWASGAQVENNNIRGVIIESKSGRKAIKAKMVIDCTGDADSAVWTGVPFENTEGSWAMAVDALYGDVDYVKFENFVKSKPDEWKRIVSESQKLSFGWTPWKTWRDDIAWLNTNFGGNAVENKTLTACEIDIRKKLKKHIEFYKANVPGFERAFMLKTADQTGIRYSRRITGDYVVTKGDLEAGSFDDSIGRNIVFTGKPLVKLPYRALLPQKIENLLFAGRCVSCTKEAQELIRGITACWIFGQAAGTAATLCFKEGVVPRKLNVATLQKSLRNQGIEV